MTWIKANTSSAQTIQKILEVKRIKVVNESDHKTCQQLTFCVSPAHTKCDASFLKTLVNQLNWWATRLQRIIRVFHSNSKDNQKKCHLLNDNANLKSRDLRDVDSTWQRLNTSLPVKGGIEGHSHEILSLKESKTVHIYVGCDGMPANSGDGSTTKEVFPDGGDTKIGHRDCILIASGTGKGSTSTRIKEDSDYSQVMIAGGGGASSGCRFKNPDWFGGGLNDSSCYYDGSLRQ